MFERYTEQARRALFFARYEAFQRGSPEIGTEHLLLALFRDEQSVTARVFARGGLSLAEVQRQVDARTSQLAPLSESSEAPFSSDAKRVLHCAAQEADRLLHSRIGTEHLLLGLLREERCTGATILNGRGLRPRHRSRSDRPDAQHNAGPPDRSSDWRASGIRRGALAARVAEPARPT